MAGRATSEEDGRACDMTNPVARVCFNGLSGAGKSTSIVERHKGMYAKARRGEIKNFTGIDDPHEPPLDPDLELDSVKQTSEQNARMILEHLQARGFVRPEKRVEPA